MPYALARQSLHTGIGSFVHVAMCSLNVQYRFSEAAQQARLHQIADFI
jgi:hypothetical protein